MVIIKGNEPHTEKDKKQAAVARFLCPAASLVVSVHTKKEV